MMVRGQWLSYADLGELLENDISRSLTVADFVLNQLHALIRTPFALLSDYCNDYDKAEPGAGLFKQLEGAEWYEFARINRNAISHNFRYEFRPRDLRVLPVTWNGLTLTTDMDGQTMRHELLWHKPGHELFLAMRDFAVVLPEPSEGERSSGCDVVTKEIGDDGRA